MDHCNAKVVVDGVRDDCPCTRMISPSETTNGPVLCRDCRHIESAHPIPKASHTLVSSLIDKVKLERDSASQAEQSKVSSKVKVEVSEEEARRETNAGYKGKDKAVDREPEIGKKSSSGRGGDTKYKVNHSSYRILFLDCSPCI